MKKKYLLAGLLLLSFYAALAQTNKHKGMCGTPEIRVPTVHHLIGNTSRSVSDTSTLYIPTTLHILGTDSGNGYYPIKLALDALCQLQTDFNEHNFHFYIEEINYIDDSDFYNMHPSDYAFQEQMYDFIEVKNTANTMNVYFVESCGGPSGFVSFEDFAGWDYSTYPPPQIHTQAQGIVLDKDFLASRDHLFTHEVGHFFGLYHTFFGNWDEFNINGTPDTIFYQITDPSNGEILPQFWLVERVNDDSCHITGDLICDTPPDYLGSFNCGGPDDEEQLDPDSVAFYSDGSFYMSYSDDDCQERFSSMQVDVMRTVAEGPREYLLYDQTPPESLSEDSLMFIHPANNDWLAVSDSVTLEWDLPGADFYLLDFGFKLNGSFIPIQSNVYLTGITYNVPVNVDQEYYWIVRAVSNYFPCEMWQDTSSFFTEVVSVQDVNLNDQLNVYPNPTTGIIHIEYDDLEVHDIRIIDVNGKIIKTVRQLNPSEINLKEYPAGLYFLEMRSKGEVFIEKVLKEK